MNGRMMGSAAAVGLVSMAVSAGLLLATSASAAPAIGVNPPAVVQAWRDIAKLPDWSGTWDPDQALERREITANPIPWNVKAATVIDRMKRDADAGHPNLVLWGCFPHGMPTWMLINHNLFEVLFTPGRVTMLGEVDGNRMRRIYTDGRPHPEDPDPTFHGHSIGKWEGDTLVVDTVGIAPQAPIAAHETYGVSNNGDEHIVERIRLRDQDTLEDTLVITAPKVLTRPWTTTRTYKRLRGPKNDIMEAQCVRGNYDEGVDADGDATFVPFTAPKTNPNR